MKFVCDFEVVGGRERLLAQVMKRKPRGPHGCEGHVDDPPLEGQVEGNAWMTRGEAEPCLIERLIGVAVSGNVPYRPACQFLEAEIGPGGEL
jgi:hypothetical protein